MQLLGFGGIERRLFDSAGQDHGRLDPFTALEHANRAQTCFRVRTILVDRQGGVPLGAALAMLPQVEQQFAPAPFQPGVGAACGVDLVEDQADLDTRLERLATGMQRQVGLKVCSATQGAGFGAQLHGFITQQPQVGEHEFGPVLVEIAEKQQA
ncbi:hypothetical protein D3C81_1716120 [compost metagenome]